MPGISADLSLSPAPVQVGSGSRGSPTAPTPGKHLAQAPGPEGGHGTVPQPRDAPRRVDGARNAAPAAREPLAGVSAGESAAFLRSAAVAPRARGAECSAGERPSLRAAPEAARSLGPAAAPCAATPCPHGVPQQPGWAIACRQTWGGGGGGTGDWPPPLGSPERPVRGRAPRAPAEQRGGGAAPGAGCASDGQPAATW